MCAVSGRYCFRGINSYSTNLFGCWYAMSINEKIQVPAIISFWDKMCVIDGGSQLVFDIVMVGTSELAIEAPAMLYNTTVVHRTDSLCLSNLFHEKLISSNPCSNYITPVE